jgi:hypothetical protein
MAALTTLLQSVICVRSAHAVERIMESFRGRPVQTGLVPPGGFRNDGHRTRGELAPP